MAVRVNGTATVPASLQTDITTIRNNVATILARIPATVALDSDMQTLLARLSATRSGYLDNLAGGAVALNADMQTMLTRWPNTRAGYVDNLINGAPTTIKNIIRGSITLSGVASNTATIAAVVLAKSLISFLGCTGDQALDSSVAPVRLTLTNTTTVTADRASATGAAVVGFQVVEYF